MLVFSKQVSRPQVGLDSGYLSAVRPIDLTPAEGIPIRNSTKMIISPALGLTDPVSTAGVQKGAFRITTAQFDPVLTPYNAGLASKSPIGTVTLSNFVVAQPNQNIDCQPILNFYVQTGGYSSGTVIDFTQSSTNAALCDATQGTYAFNVVYNSNGTWSVTPFRPILQMEGSQTAAPRSLRSQQNGLSSDFDYDDALNVVIKNEAGTRVICTGEAANLQDPVVVQNLDNPQMIVQGDEYQVGVPGDHFVGRMCTHIHHNSATFK
jgi:hypothetical protein